MTTAKWDATADLIRALEIHAQHDVTVKLEPEQIRLLLKEIVRLRNVEGSSSLALNLIEGQTHVVDGVPGGKFSYETLENTLREIGELVARAALNERHEH